MIKHIAFTVYPVQDMTRARGFYEDALGLKLTHNFRDQWVEYHLPNGCLALTTMMEGVRPAADAGGSIALEVADVDAEAARLRARGVVFKIEPFATPVCKNVILLDTEGNALTLHQSTRGDRHAAKKAASAKKKPAKRAKR
jgi:predicted enzyme related to lactoylglutathione lyase